MQFNKSWPSTLATYATTLFQPDPTVTFIELPAACLNERNFVNATSYQPPAVPPAPPPPPLIVEWMPYLVELNGRMNKYGTPAIIGVGCAGNILSVLVFFLTNLRKQSSSYYLAALGISDTCFLLITLVSWLSLYNITVFHQPGYCQTFTYMSGVFSFLSVWFVVGFTVERFIAVQYPLKRQTMCTVRRAKIVLVLMTLAASITYTPLFVLTESVFNAGFNGSFCAFTPELKVRVCVCV